MHPAPPVWRFVAAEDIEELGVLAGDIVTHQAGRHIRVVRQLPANSGLLLNLLMQDRLVEIDDVIGPNRDVLDALESLDREPTQRAALRVIR